MTSFVWKMEKCKVWMLWCDLYLVTWPHYFNHVTNSITWQLTFIMWHHHSIMWHHQNSLISHHSFITWLPIRSRDFLFHHVTDYLITWLTILITWLNNTIMWLMAVSLSSLWYWLCILLCDNNHNIYMYLLYIKCVCSSQL